MKRNLTQAAEMRLLIGSPAYWDLLMDYVAVEEKRIVNQLLSCSEGELKSLQGEIKALMKLKNLSVNLKSEEASRKR